MRFLLLLSVLFSSVLFASERIVLTSKNTVVINAEVSDESMSKALVDIHKLYHAGSTEIYLVLNTPGGSVDAGSLFIDVAKRFPIPIHTVTIFAASMGYQIVQGLGKRYILESGTLMSHRASGGMRGEFYGNLDTRIDWIKQGVDHLDKVAADRIGISLAEYKELVRDELWLVGQNAIDKKNADIIADVICGPDLMGSHKETVNTIFGSYVATFSNCPIITYPLEIQSVDESKELKEYTTLLFKDKAAFVKKYILK